MRPDRTTIDPENIFSRPPDLLQFLATEHQQLLTSLVNCREEVDFLAHLHGLYLAAMERKSVDVKRVLVFQLLTLAHYHFLFSCASYMRCHMAEGFSSARIAIDAALIAAYIIKDPQSQAAYIERKKPFDKLIRHYKNMIRDNKQRLPHSLIEPLIELHDACSEFASHADVQTFAHRLDFLGEPRKDLMAFGYFQFPRRAEEMSFYLLQLLKIYVMVLDVFSGFLVEEHKSLPEAWRTELHMVGNRIEARQRALS